MNNYPLIISGEKINGKTVLVAEKFTCMQEFDIAKQIDSRHTARARQRDIVHQIVNRLAIRGLSGCNLLAEAISNGIGKHPDWLIIKEIKEMAELNYNSVVDVLGALLTERIVNFK